MIRVILESPFAGNIEKNIEYARECVRDSLSRGEAPIASHLLYTQDGILDDDIPEERKWGIDAGLAWKNVAEKHVVYIDLGITAGMEYGLKFATENNIPIERRRIRFNSNRIQRTRTKGSKKPDNCKYVGRPTKFGNPFKLNPDGSIMCFSINRTILDPWIFWKESAGFTIDDIINLYRRWINKEMLQFKYLPIPPDIEELKGFDLSCFCSLDKPCHVDVLIELLNKY